MTESTTLPAPPRLRMRQALQFARIGRKSLYDGFDHLATIGSVLDVGWGPLRYVYLFGADANEYLLSTNAKNFTWREAFSILIPINGDTALVVSDGEDHKRRRKVVQPAFHLKRISGYLDVMVAETNAVIDRWQPGHVVDAYDEFRLAIRDIVLRCLFGEGPRARADELAEHLQVGLDYVNKPPYRRFDRD